MRAPSFSKSIQSAYTVRSTNTDAALSLGAFKPFKPMIAFLALGALSAFGAFGICGCGSSGDDGQTNDDASAETGDADLDAHDTKKPPTEAGADTGSVDEGVDAGCNAVTNIATQVTENDINAELPVGIGGLIPDGIFVVTAYTRYTGVGGKNGPGTHTVVETISITSGNIAGVRQVDSDLGYGYNASVAPSGGKLAWKQTCPTGQLGVTYDYSIGNVGGAETIDLYDKDQRIDTTYTRKILKP